MNALVKARRVSSADIATADQILPGVAPFLPAYAVSMLIRADLTDDEIHELAAEQKLFVGRLREYLPDLLGYFDFETESQVENFIGCVDDCHGDFLHLRGARRSDRARRESSELIVSAIENAQRLSNDLGRLGLAGDVQFRRSYNAVNNRPRFDGRGDEVFGDIEFLISFLRLKNFLDSEPSEFTRWKRATATSSVVEYAHTMSCFWRGPRIVTTPGSDFSSMCSLLYEIVSGETDKSLAGTVNRYARSSQRRDMELLDEEISPEYEQKIDRNNFHFSLEAARRAGEAYLKYTETLKCDDLPEGTGFILSALALEEKKSMDNALNEYGPHLLWAHQYSSAHHAERNKELEEKKAKLKAMEIELGRLRRQARNLNVKSAEMEK